MSDLGRRKPFTRILAATLLVLVVTVEGCLCTSSEVNRGDVNLVPLDQEWELGEQLSTEILHQAQVVHDPLVQEYVEAMGREIAAVTELADRPWTFHVLADTSVNAFNIPGGHVFVHSGLIAAADTPSELAGVVAHEVAHGVARHSTERMTTAYGLDLVLRLLAGSETGMIEQIAAGLLGSGAMAKFSRDHEREADDLGLDFMAEAGYDPEGMVTMFEEMLALRQRRPNAAEQFFSTHPLTEERVATMARRAADLPSGAEEASPEALARVQSRLPVPEP